MIVAIVFPFSFFFFWQKKANEKVRAYERADR